MDMSKQESSKHSLPPVGVRQQSIGHHFSSHLSSSQPKTPVPQSPAVAPGKGNGNGEQQSPFQQFPVHQGQDQPTGPHQQQDPQQSNISGATSPPSQMPQSPDPSHDLPMELLQKGWRRFWSKREQRWYFFNKFNNQSMWEMPPIGSPAGPNRHDPLGIQITEGKAQQPPTPLPAGSPGLAPVRRKSSVDGHPLSPTMRKDMLKGLFWDFTLESNATMHERFPCTLPPPHNDIELMRSVLVSKLRQQYHELCMAREGIHAPSESFNRWLLERMVVDKGKDPMLPSQCPDPVSSSMMREIMSDIPIKLYRPNLHSHARKLLVKYAEAAKKMIESRPASSESRKLVKWNAEDIFQWTRKQPNCTIDECMKRLTYLKDQCGPHLCEVARSSIENICTKVYTLSCDTCAKLQKKHWEILKEHHIEEPPPFTRPPSERKIRCYNIQMAVQSPRLPTVDVHEEGSVTCLRYKGEMMKINTQHMMKLDALYQFNCRDDPTRHNFLPRAWCLLRRYQTLFGLGENEGHNLQGALPTGVFKALNEHFGVTFECFASPLNCYFKQYCSAFVDTDSYFGSRGPILDFFPFSGSFEANPPFGEELMEATVIHFEKLLERTTDPLSFIVFTPDWRDPITNALKMLEASRFKRRQEVIPAYEHEYRIGNQHAVPESSVSSRAVHGTMMIFLQNDEGNRVWPPTDEGIRAVMDVAKPKSAPSTPSRKRSPKDQELSPPRKKLTMENEFNGNGSKTESSYGNDSLSGSVSSSSLSSDAEESRRDLMHSTFGTAPSYSPAMSARETAHTNNREHKRNSPRGAAAAADYSSTAAFGSTVEKQDFDNTNKSWFHNVKPVEASHDAGQDRVSYGRSNSNEGYGGSVIQHTSPLKKDNILSPPKPSYSTSSQESPKSPMSLVKNMDNSKASNLPVINWFVDTKSKPAPAKTLADYTVGNTTGNWTEAIRPLETKPVLSSPVKFESKSGSKWTPISKPSLGSPEKLDEGIDVYEWKDDDEDTQPMTTSPLRRGAKAIGKGAMKLKAVKRLDSTLSSNQTATQKSTVVGGRVLRSRRGEAK
ncbi:mRNA (2'-O-methyladenosine-N(6)-)-methyltransferase [Strongylocentrotus purpuratus]|uniref:WW domain-containing protein n=1 Tax=Strongylocentrotus purpuratus TaxID=7668 RepID=A0A7M7RBK4_STRPU|nr:mRNA (2'-O-methyladenosine-N(6)-)-methyltransferase [Strongylocentrotus purpuratus]